MLRVFSVFFCSFLLGACSVEHVGKSPLGETFANTSGTPASLSVSALSETITVNEKIAELTNNIAKIPRTRNHKLNEEVEKLKSNVLNFIYQYEEANIEEQKRYMESIQKNYIGIHTMLKKHENQEEFRIFNHYLVRFKAELNSLNEMMKDIQ